MDKTLTIGIPKGSLQEATLSLFAAAGLSFYGAERLRLLVAANHARSAGELAALIFEEVEKFAGGMPAADDGTLVVMKVR